MNKKCGYILCSIRRNQWEQMVNGTLHGNWQSRLVISRLKSGDTVSFSTWSDGRDYFFRKKGAVHRASLSKFIYRSIEPDFDGEFTDACVEAYSKGNNCFIHPTDGLERQRNGSILFKRLPGICKDIRILTVHSQMEEIPDYEGDIRFVDMESGSGVEVSVNQDVQSKIIKTKSKT